MAMKSKHAGETGLVGAWMVQGPDVLCWSWRVKLTQGVHSAALSPWETAFWGEAENPEFLCLLYG